MRVCVGQMSLGYTSTVELFASPFDRSSKPSVQIFDELRTRNRGGSLQHIGIGGREGQEYMTGRVVNRVVLFI